MYMTTLMSGQLGLALTPLGTTIVVLVRFISRLNHCFWDRNARLTL